MESLPCFIERTVAVERLWWVLSFVASIGIGCATSIPVDCPAGSKQTDDGIDCDLEPFSEGDGGGGSGGGGAGGTGPVTCEDLECDDGNECTEDSCEDAVCSHAAVADGIACTVDAAAGLCDSGECVIDCSVEDCRPRYPCTEQGIRDAIADGGNIVVDCAVPTTVMLTAGVLEIEKDLSLDGLGNLTIDADGQSRALITSPPAIVEVIGVGITGGATPPTESTGGVAVRGGSQLTLRQCRIFGNVAGKHCGALGNSGVVIIIDSEITENLANDRGGGLCNNEDMTIIDSVISGNRADNDGGALYNTSDGIVTIQGSTITKNVASDLGGGIWTSAPLITITDSALTENRARGAGALRLWTSAEVRVLDSVIADNVVEDSGGAMSIYEGRVFLDRTQVTQNSAANGRGGAVHIETEAVLDVTDSVFSHNVAQHGGAVYGAEASLRMRRSVAYGNYASGIGGAFRIYKRGSGAHDLELESSTLSGNEAGTKGGAMAISNGTVARVLHATIANNVSPLGSGIQQDNSALTEVGYSAMEDGCAVTDDSPFVSLGHNRVVDAGAGTCVLTGPDDSVLTSEQMALGVLDLHGGLTPTHLPALGSLLVDAIAAELCHAEVLVDQRGEPRDGLSPCDVGAVEVQPDD